MVAAADTPIPHPFSLWHFAVILLVVAVLYMSRRG